MSKKSSLIQRSVTSVSWNVVASVVQVVVGFARSILLARLLPVQVFGTYAWAGSVVSLSSAIASFGMGGAFLHRTTETQDEEQTSAVHFTLQFIFVSAWAILMTVGALVFADGQIRTAWLVLTITEGGFLLSRTPRLILARRVVHRRLAVVQVLNILLSALVALALAWRGVTLWALLATNLVTLFLYTVALYVWRPVWRPRIVWDPWIMRYFLRFGSRKFLAEVFLKALDRFDDMWTGIYLGKTALGFYSRAYTFATYPRKILATPVNAVAGGTYAELKGNRKRLSQAFFRINAFLIRSGFLIAGLLALVSPEFVRLVLTAKWLPMLDAFRLMLVYTLFDPIKLTVAALFVAVGKPEQVVKARLVQLVVLVVGLLLLGPSLGIAGVALAVDAMLITGIGLLLWQARVYVDFSPVKLFGPPLIAMSIGMGLACLGIVLPGVSGSDWRTAGVKASVFVVAYSASLMLLERKTIRMNLNFLRNVYETRVHGRTESQVPVQK